MERPVVPSTAPPVAGDAQAANWPARNRQAGLWHQVKRNRWAYLFISPFFILFAIFGLFPPLYSFFLSFNKWDIISRMEFVGFDNYVRVLGDRLFWKAFVNNLTFIVMATAPGLPLALFIAYLIDTYVRRLRDAFLAGFFSPMVTSSVATAVVFTIMYGTNYGVFNALVRALGMEPIRWLDEPWPMKFALAILLIWRWLGWNVILYLAGLQSIPDELYEVARVDGANGLQIFFRITVPLVRPTVLYTVVISFIGMLQLFAEPYLLTGGAGGASLGGRANSLLTMVVYLYQSAFRFFQFGYASAISYVMFVLILFFSLLNLKIIGRSSA